MDQVRNQPTDQGEKSKLHVPEHQLWNKDMWLDKIKQLRKSINEHYDKGGKVEAIVKALRKAESEASNDADRANAISKRSAVLDEGKVSKKNILYKARNRKGTIPTGGENHHASKESSSSVKNLKRKKSNESYSSGGNLKQKKSKIEVGNRVKIKTTAFGKGYAEGKPEFTYGFVRKRKGDLYDVEWDAGDFMLTHKRHLSAHHS